MAAYRGTLMTIKDKNTPVPTKLKLARFAWAKPEVIIPNKYQQILDFVCGLLVNKKKNNLEKLGEAQVWQTLLDFLKASQSSIAVKPSILQSVTECILTHVKEKSVDSKQDKKHLADVLDCGVLLLSVTSVHSSLFSGLCQLLSATCRLCVIEGLDDASQSRAETLLHITLSVLLKRQTTYHDQGHVVFSIASMLPIILKYQETKADAKLQSFLLTSLFHRDHKDSHAYYLRLTHWEEADKKPSFSPTKYIVKLYTVISEQVSPYLLCTFLPAFATEFLKQHQSDPSLCFLLLKHVLTKILKLSCDDQAQMSKLPDHLTPDLCISCLAGCLKAFTVAGCDLFATDKRQDVTKLFCQLMELVLPQTSISSWCDFVMAVLNLSPLVIEKYLTEILKGVLTKRSRFNTENEVVIDRSLSEVVGVFMKLRRTLDFLTSLLKAIDSGVKLDENFSCFVQFKEKLGVMFNEAPITSVMDMWEKIEEGLESAIQEGKCEERTKKLSWLLFLLDTLLSHGRFFDQRNIGVAGKKLHSLLELTESNVLLALSKAKEVTGMTDLLVTWSSVKMLLYPKWREEGSLSCEGPGKLEDDKTTNRLLKKVPVATRIRLHLQRRVVATPDSDTADMKRHSDDINELMEEVMDFPVPTKKNVFTLWTGDETNITLVHGPLVQFKEFSALFPLVGHSLTDENIHKCAKFIVDVLSLVEEKDTGTVPSMPTGTETPTSLYQAVMEFLNHPSTRENGRLQTHLVCLVWGRLLAPSSDGKTHSPKKKKVRKSLTMESSGKATVSKLFGFIIDPVTETADFTIFPEEIPNSLRIAESSSPALIDLLTSLDVEYLTSINLKCQLGFLAMASCLRDQEVKKIELLSRVEAALIHCLTGQNLTQFFSCVKPEKFFEFALSLCSEPVNMSRKFLELAIQAIMYNRMAVLSMLPLVKRLATDLRNTYTKPSTVQILAASSLIHNCKQYIAKSFHIEEIASAAMDIFCTLAKVTVKHAQDWMSQDMETSLVKEGKKTRKTKDTPKPGSAKKGKKRKLVEDDNEEKSDSQSDIYGDKDMWYTVMECVTEVVWLWSHDIADTRMNEQLSALVKDIRTRMKRKEDLFFGGEMIADQVKLVHLNFMKAVCLCNSRLSHTTPSSSSSSSPPPSSFSLLNDKDVANIWLNVFAMAKSDLMTFVSTSRDSEDRKNNNNPDESLKKISSLMQHEQRTDKGVLEGIVSVIDMSSWPKPLIMCVDVLLCVVGTETLDKNKFVARLASLTKLLDSSSESDLPSMFIALSVWRRLLNSSYLTEDLVTLMSDSMYQYLSTTINLLHHLGHLRVGSSSSISTTSSTLASVSSSTLSLTSATATPKDNQASTTTPDLMSVKRESNPHPHLASPLCRFILKGLSEFIILAKNLNAPDIATICLLAAPSFTLECPSDVKALQGLINAYVVHHPFSAIKAASAVMVSVSKLVCACVHLGSQTRLSDQYPGEVDDVVSCAQLVSRVLVVLASGDFKSELGKIAHCVLSDYVMEVQKGALHPKVKRELVRGLYLLMGICDNYRLAALNATLPSGVRETFKFMHQDFEKYYRYQGTV